MRGFVKQVAAYLTGWVIAQTFHNRVVNRDLDDRWGIQKNDIAVRVADELESRRRPNREPWQLFEEGVPSIATRIYNAAALGLYNVDHQEFVDGCRAAFQAVVDDSNEAKVQV